MRDQSFKNLPKSTQRLLRFSQCRLFLTSFVVEVWPVLGLAALFVGLSLGNAFAYVPAWLHAIFLFLFPLVFLFTLYRGYKRLYWPKPKDILRQLEIHSDVTHRPLNNLVDTLSRATHSESHKILWKRHIKHARDQLLKIKLLKPEKTLKQQDPYRLGFVALLVCLIGFILAGSERQERFTHAITFPEHVAEQIIPSYAIPTAHLTAWITPPEYIKKETAYIHEGPLLRNKTARNFDVTQESVLTIHTANARYFPVYVYVNGVKHQMAQNSEGQYSFELPIKEDVTIKLVHMFIAKEQWKITSVPDEVPTVTVHDKFNVNERQEVEWSYTAKDDYGITKLDMFVTPDFALQEKLRNAPMTEAEKKQFHMAIPISQKHIITELDEQRALDMGKSVFAGEDVVLTMVVEDSNQQIGQSKPRKLTLPVRTFEHPIAQRLIEFRKTLSWSTQRKDRMRIWRELQSITARPQKYKEDKSVFLALTVAHMSLERIVTTEVPYDHTKRYEQWLKRLKNIRDLLWDTALHIEDGNLAVMASQLRDAIQNLSERMKNENLTEEEFKKLAAQLQETMAQYMQALSEAMKDKFENSDNSGEGMPKELMQRLADKMDAGSAFRKWQEMMENGSPEDLQKLLEQMQQFVEQMDPEKLKNAKIMDDKEFKEMKELQELIEQQQELIDETQKEQDRQEDKQQSSSKSQELKEKQEEIRKKMTQIMKDLEKKGPIPEGLKKSEEAMKKAEESLEKGDLPSGVEYEKEALAGLQEGMDGELERLAKMLENAMNIGFMAGGGQDGDKDPLGRKQGDGDKADTSDVEIPEEKERRKVQEIIKKLRARSNDYKRPQFEKDYIERLLKRF